VTLPVGTTKIKAPKTKNQTCACADGASWTMRVQFPVGTTCAGIVAPNMGGFASVVGGSPPASCFGVSNSCAGFSGEVGVLLTQFAIPEGGVFVLLNSNAACSAATCVEFGCNGTGGVWQ
jgi:hypothetical protein